MPTLVRIFIFLLFIGGLGVIGMIALTVTVDPGEKDITIKIPAREMAQASKPLDINDLPAPVNIAPKDGSSASGAVSVNAPASAAPSIDVTDSAASAPGVKTVDVGAGE